MGERNHRLTGDGIWGQPKDPAEARRVLKRTLELGVNFIDTADAYGPNVDEELIAAALYPYPTERIGEMACLTVSPEAQGSGDGERLLKRIEQRARARGLTRIFVLTTRTEHWFLKRGFVKVTVDDLPEDRRRLYNWQRKSLVLMKQL